MKTDQAPPAAQHHHREAGSGPGVVCIHCNGSTSAQWRPLMERLATRHHVMAPDTHGAGRGPAWPHDRKLMLSDEVDLLEPIMERLVSPITLIGHSYGAAVALLAALRWRERVHALVMYEPVLFAWVDAASPPPNAADGIRDTVERATAALAAGNRSKAGEIFIDYWMGTGAWFAKPEAQRHAIEAAVVNVQGWGQALFGEPTPLAACRALALPVLLMQGSESTPSARAVCTLLSRTLPRVETLVFEGPGHMGPITHPEKVDAAIEAFLRRHPVRPTP